MSKPFTPKPFVVYVESTDSDGKRHVTRIGPASTLEEAEALIRREKRVDPNFRGFLPPVGKLTYSIWKASWEQVK